MVEKLRMKPKTKSLHTVDLVEESPHTKVGRTPRTRAWTSSTG